MSDTDRIARTQTERVLAALRRSGERGICQTDFLAPDVIDGGPPITRLPARIKELKEAGHRITYGGTRNKCRVYRALESYYRPTQDGCWMWLGSRNQNGYGMLGRVFAHRAVFEHYKGPVPDGLVLDHLCRTPLCVNPAHLEAVTHAVNMQRGANAKITGEVAEEIRNATGTMDELVARFGVNRSSIWRIRRAASWNQGRAADVQSNATKTHCLRGHPLSGENLRIRANGARVCRACVAADGEARRERARQQREAQGVLVAEPGQPPVPSDPVLEEAHFDRTIPSGG